MKLASISPDAATLTSVYTCPANHRAVLTLNLCNRTANVTKVRIALTDGAAPTDADWIEYDVTIGANAVLIRSGIALGAGQRVYVQTDLATTTATVFGIVESV